MIPLRRPKTMLGYRPEKYSDMIKLDDIIKKGLGTGQRLYLNAGAQVNGADTLGLSEWMEAIYNDFSNKGLEGTCSIYDAIHRTERNIFTDYGSLTMEEVEKWAQDLIINGVKYPNPSRPGYYVRVAPCPFDEANCRYGTQIIKDSVDPVLWSQVVDDIGCDPAGPVALLAVAQTIHQTSASSSRQLVDQLVKMMLTDQPGENVLKFSKKLSDLAKRIECCKEQCADLDAIVAKCFMSATNESFRVGVIGHYNLAQKRRGIGWKKMLVELKKEYNTALGYGMWSAAAKTKAEAVSQHEEVILKALTAQSAAFNALQQKVDRMSSSSSDPTGNPPSTPSRRQRGPRRIPPGPGEANTKMIDGILNEWCAKCQYWTFGDKQHNGDTHISRPRSERTDAASSTPVSSTSTAVIDKPLTPSIKFSNTTKNGSISIAAESSFPARNRLQMIGSMYVASSTSTTTDPPPPPLPVTEGLVFCLPVHDEPLLGLCEICGAAGPEGIMCATCDHPDVLYAVQHCGYCVICGDYGPTGRICLDCGSDTGGVYAPPDGSTTPLAPAPIIESPPNEYTINEQTQLEDFFEPWLSDPTVVEHDDGHLSYDDDVADDASFQSAISHVSSTSQVRTCIATTHHLNFSAGQDSS
jgi:hypothetical protein